MIDRSGSRSPVRVRAESLGMWSSVRSISAVSAVDPASTVPRIGAGGDDGVSVSLS